MKYHKSRTSKNEKNLNTLCHHVIGFEKKTAAAIDYVFIRKCIPMCPMFSSINVQTEATLFSVPNKRGCWNKLVSGNIWENSISVVHKINMLMGLFLG